MIFDIPNINLNDEEWIYIITEYLNGWTEIPLSLSDGYDVDKLKFYDGLLGTLLKETEKLLKLAPAYINREFVDSWKYQGKLYRVIHSHYDFDDEESEPHRVMPNVDYHRLITHWTDDYTFEGLTYKLPTDCEYIILEAETRDRIAFDVNRFRKIYHCERPFTQKEREIIFPMYKENIKEYSMTINEFIELKNRRSCFNGQEKRIGIGLWCFCTFGILACTRI